MLYLRVYHKIKEANLIELTQTGLRVFEKKRYIYEPNFNYGRLLCT